MRRTLLVRVLSMFSHKHERIVIVTEIRKHKTQTKRISRMFFKSSEFQETVTRHVYFKNAVLSQSLLYRYRARFSETVTLLS